MEPALRSVQASIEALTERIKEEALKEPVGSLQANLESVGPQTALSLVRELGDVTRFTSTRPLCQHSVRHLPSRV